MGRKEKNIQPVSGGSGQAKDGIRGNRENGDRHIERSFKTILDNPETKNTTSLNGLNDLPYIELNNRKLLPNISGIYFVIEEGSVLYIGRAKNIKKRWTGHHRLKELQQYHKFCTIHWLVCSEEKLLSEIEKALIAYWKPMLNNTLLNKAISTPSYPYCLIPENILLSNKKNQALIGGRYVTERESPKQQRGTRLTDTAWKGLQLLADHHGDRSRAEYLERLVREECERLGIDLESVAKPEKFAA